jgi:hypothetical protein
MLDILKIFFNNVIHTTNDEVLESAQHRYVQLQQMSYKIPNGSQILIWGQRHPTFPTPQDQDTSMK